ncbi:hypothetical protein KKF91_09445 [Myxococcota bacterium]|nr:hypothetical protein [Myxococcota bacterium]MBU1430766.1 hypothetical protein [Myxococcota bacterium]MBU1898040.1 hypothetical protein [Myxococcota bacterium]
MLNSVKARWSGLGCLLLDALLPGVIAAAGGAPRRLILTAVALLTSLAFWLKTLRHPAPILMALALLWAGSLWRGRGACWGARVPWRRALLLIGLGYGLMGALLSWGASSRFGVTRIDSEELRPTLLEGDWLLYRRGVPLRPGRLIVVAWPDGVAVSRLIAVGPATLHLQQGCPVVNGRAFEQRPLSHVEIPARGALTRAALGLEGRHAALERTGHAAYVVFYERPRWQQRDLPAITLAPGEIFVIGDQREASLRQGRWGRLPARRALGVPTLTLFSSQEGRRLRGRVGLEVGL